MLQYELSPDRRCYQRYKPPIYCKMVRKRSSETVAYCPLVDISLNGMRIHTNQPLDTHKQLQWELLFPDGSTIRCKTRIVWVIYLPSWASFNCEAGLQFLELSAEDSQRLIRFLQISPTLVNLWEKCTDDSRRQPLSSAFGSK